MAAKHLLPGDYGLPGTFTEERRCTGNYFSNYITKADILFERELFEEAFNQLNKAQKTCSDL